MKTKVIAVVLVLMMVLSLSLTLTACKTNDDTPTEAYVSLDINPAIELIVDKDNKVVSVRGENEDGQVLLYQEAGIEGVELEVAIGKIIDLAVEYGYLSEDNKVVDTLVSSSNDKYASELLAKVNTTVTATADNLGLKVTTDSEGAYSLLRKYEEFKKQHPNNEAIQKMSVSKFKLALSVSETDGITLETAVEMDDGELIETLKVSSAQIEEYATKAYIQAKEMALETYDKAIEMSQYAVYAKFYAEKVISKPMTAYYGSVYQIYAAAANGLNFVCDMTEYVSSLSDYPLSEEQVNAIVVALGLESSDELKNSKGEVTIGSVEAYADKMFKNTEASAKLEEMKSDLSEALSQAETTVKEKINEISTEYQPQIEATIELVDQYIATMQTFAKLLPENVQTIINNSVNDINEIVVELRDLMSKDEITVEAVREKAKFLDGKAEEYRKNIEADLTEEELADLENRKAEAVNKMTAQKKEFEDTLAKAEEEAKNYLESLKTARKNNKE